MAFFDRKRRAPLVLLPLVLLSGCVTVDIAEKKVTKVENPTTENTAVNYDTAMGYLQTTRRAYLERAKLLEGVDAATRAGVGISVVGAGVSATLEHHAAKKAGKFLTYGAVSFVANKNIAPIEISRVYRAGATNLECIRAAAVVGKTHADQIDGELKSAPQRLNDVVQAADDLEKVVFKIRDVVADPSRAAPPPAQPAAKPAAKKGKAAAAAEEDAKDVATIEKVGDLTAPAAEAINAVKEARKLVRSVRLFQAENNLGERVLAGVNGTRQIVNDLALARTPDVEAILQSGSAFARFTSTGASWLGDIKSAYDSVDQALESGKSNSAKPGEARSLVASLKDELQAKEIVLRAALAALPDTSLADDFAAIAQCQTAVGVYKPVTVSPNPIKATIGGDAVKLTLTGKAPFTGRDLPNHVIFDGSAKSPTLKADDKAEAGDHAIHFTDAFGVDSGGVTLTLEAKKADPAKETDKKDTDKKDTDKKEGAADKKPVANGPAATPQDDDPADKKAGDKKGDGA